MSRSQLACPLRSLCRNVLQQLWIGRSDNRLVKRAIINTCDEDQNGSSHCLVMEDVDVAP